MRSFKPLLFALATAVAGITAPAVAQDYSISWNPRSGDVWVDSYLGDVNRYGSRYQDPFVNEMVRYYGAPRDLVVELLGTRRWAPGDVYYACAIAQILGRPCRYVADYWGQHHGKGWGAVAQELGIKPGSAEFHRLKKGFVPTYDRWGRPITLSDDLRADFPGRGRGASGGHTPGQGAKGKGAKVSDAPNRGGPQGKAAGAAGKSGAAKGPPAGKGRDPHGQGQGGGKGKPKGNGNG